jgi:hypothetical protein
MLDTVIADGLGTKTKTKVTDDNFLAVATKPYFVRTNQIRAFTNPDYGINMNINATPTGTPLKIHNGLDTVEWTASSIIGTWDFESTTQKKAGSKSIDGTSTVNNDTCQFLNPAGDVDLNNYVSISGWIYIGNWPAQGVKELNIYGWDSGTASIVGTSINLGNYVNTGTLNVWQKFSVNLTDMLLNTATIDSIRINTVDLGIGAAIDFYIDEFQLESPGAGGSPTEYKIEPNTGTLLNVHSITMAAVDLYDGTLANSGVMKLEYDKLLGQTLTTGITYKRLNKNVIEFAISLASIADILSLPGMTVDSYGTDGTNTVMTLSYNYAEPVILDPRFRDYLSFTINDDLSTMIRLRALANCTEEIIGQ